MFRLIIFACCLHLSVALILRGRILLDGDAEKSVCLATGAKLLVSFEDVSVADRAAITIQQAKVSNLVTFPISYEMEIPSNLSPEMTHSLSARITKATDLLYINDQHTPVAVGTDSPIIRDIAVISLQRDGKADEEQTAEDNMKQLSWPEMLGKEGTYAVQYIKEKSGLTDVFTFPENSPMTMDYRTDRVRVIVNNKGIVIQVPRTG